MKILKIFTIWLSSIISTVVVLSAAQPMEVGTTVNFNNHGASLEIKAWLKDKYLLQKEKTRGLVADVPCWVIGASKDGEFNEITRVVFSSNNRHIYIDSSYDKILTFDLMNRHVEKIGNNPEYLNSLVTGKMIRSKNNDDRKFYYTKSEVISPDGTYTVHIERIQEKSHYFKFYIEFNEKILDQSFTPEQINVLEIIKASNDEGRSQDLCTQNYRSLYQSFSKLSPSLQLFLSHSDCVIIMTIPDAIGWLQWYLN